MKSKKIIFVAVSNIGILLLLIVAAEFSLRALVPNGEIALRIKMNKLARRTNLEEARDKVFDSEKSTFIPKKKFQLITLNTNISPQSIWMVGEFPA